ncbi:MAG: 50S ribosomal protein L4 [Nitrosopumilaceae archaeon]|nr:50S ribosomal protein L4 [Nitrosopumilaceae archaeon]
MNAHALSLAGSKESEVELPPVFFTPFRKDLIHKAYVNLDSHRYQRQGRHPTAGMDVVAMSNDPPTGHGTARIARMRGGGGGRQGQAGGVASTRGGRQAHPPIVERVIYKKLNKKENTLALCSAIAATASKELVEMRGHKVEGIESFPIVVSDDIESVSTAKEMKKILDSLKLSQDIARLSTRKARTGKSALRGRKTKIGKSILFVTKNPEKLARACGSFSGVDVIAANNLSVLDLAPGAHPIRLTVYSKSAIDEIAKIKSTHLELMVNVR